MLEVGSLAEAADLALFNAYNEPDADRWENRQALS